MRDEYLISQVGANNWAAMVELVERSAFPPVGSAALWEMPSPEFVHAVIPALFASISESRTVNEIISQAVAEMHQEAEAT